MNRLRAPRFKAAAAVVIAALFLSLASARAQDAPHTTFWFAGTRLIFDSPVALSGDIAVSVHDSGLSRLLARVGASLSYVPGARYVVITSADRRTVNFTVGDARYSVGGIVTQAAFAPFFDGGDVIVPLYAVARALYIEPIPGGTETVFEPQLGTLDIRPDGRRTVVTLHAATALKYGALNETPERVSLTFSGVGSALAARRQIGGGVDEVDVAVAGNAKNPSATVTIVGAKGARHLIARPNSPYEFSVVFGPTGVALDPSVPAAPDGPPADAARAAGIAAAANPATPPPGAEPMPNPPVEPAMQATPQSGPAKVVSIEVVPQPDGGVNLRLTLDGTATYDWHRLRDDRWYLDIANATLAGGAHDERPATPVVDSVRVHQIGSPHAPVVRVAFTLHGDRRIDVTPADNALTIAVANVPAASLAHTGNGQIGGATVAQSSAESPAGPPVAPIAPAPRDTPWKFAPPNTDSNRVIVIDPGHGGADAGTAHNGLVEKKLTLDIALRLRTLLAAAGWSVRLTHDTDIDPLAPQTLAAFAADGRPNAGDRAYLQTRCDVANAANARMFISIHVNYADATSVHGTTFYYTKPQDVPLAQALERALIPVAGTQDDGVIKSNLYVTKHTTMPAVLVETGFISNPGDVQLLSDPNFLQNVAAGIAAGVKAYAGALPALSSQNDQ